MAQQITSNNSSMIDMMTATNNYADNSSAVKFDDILNKTIATNQVSDQTQTTSFQVQASLSTPTTKNETKTVDTEVAEETIELNLKNNVPIIIDEEIVEDLDIDVDTDTDVDVNVDVDVDVVLDNVQTENVVQIDKPIIPEGVTTPVVDTKDLTDKVMVKIADDSVIRETTSKLSEIYTQLKTDTVSDTTPDNLITQDLIDELNVEIVASQEGDTVIVEDTTQDMSVLLNDSYENEMREKIEAYSNEKISQQVETSDTVVVKETTKTDKLEKVEKVEVSDEVEIESENEIVSQDTNKNGFNQENDNKEFDSEDSIKFEKKSSKKTDLREEMLTFNDAEEPIEVESDVRVETTISVNNIESNHHTVHSQNATQNVQTKGEQTISRENILSQIHDKLQSMNKIVNSKLTMVLNPETLGKVTVQLTNTNNGLIAEMIVDTAEVKEILDSNLSNLKESLTGQGVNVDNVTIKVAESENGTEMDYTEQDNSENGKGQQQRNGANKEDENKFAQMFSEIRDNDNDEVKEMGEE